MHWVLRHALTHAVKWGMLTKNPVDLVDAPKPLRKDPNVVDESGMLRHLEAARGGHLYLPMLMAAATGMRRGEILALRWQDVELVRDPVTREYRGIITVRRSLEQTSAGLNFKLPKTERSARKITIPAILGEALVAHKGKQAQLRLLMGAAYQDHDLVVAREDGMPRSPRNFSHAFYEFVRKKGLPVIRFHDLRHSHASILLKAGESVNVVADRLGHTDPGMTLRIYGHVLPGMQQQAANRFDEAMRPKPPLTPLDDTAETA